MKIKSPRFLKYICMLLTILFSTVLWSCSSDGESPEVPTDPQNPKTAKSTVLVYAVATNSLEYNLVSDKAEMLEAAKDINLEENNILLFETRYIREDNVKVPQISLLKLVAEGNSYLWKTEKEYIDGKDSLDPERVSEIISLIDENYPAEKYGLVFWSHSTGASPVPEDETVRNVGTSGSNLQVSLPLAGWFGQDLTANDKNYTYLGIENLAAAIPNHFFHYIWFDSCLMSNIESIYQFRDKCDYYIGYATEVLEYGLPYDMVLPYMVGENMDLIKGADLFYQYYSRSIATVAVVDMSKLEQLADVCSEAYMEIQDIGTTNLLKYTRGSAGPFYDLGDYTKAMAEANGVELTTEKWNSALDECVVYKAATDYNFSQNRIDPERYSGISTHIYSENNSEAEEYYKSLDWYSRVFKIQ